MEAKAQSWCGLVVRQDGISVCLLCGTHEQQVRLFQNGPEDYPALIEWLKAEGCSHVALRPDDDNWKQVREALDEEFRVKVIYKHQLGPAESEDHKTCCKWLANLLKSGRLENLDQVEPIGDRFPHSDEDALGGQPGKKPEHSGQEKD